MFSLQESVRPSADLRNHYSEISRQCRENKEAVIITVNGRGDDSFMKTVRVADERGAVQCRVASGRCEID